MSPDEFIHGLSRLAGDTASADLADWQVLAALQSRLADLARGATAAQRERLSAGQEQVSALFSADLTAAEIEALRNDLLTVLAAIAELTDTGLTEELAATAMPAVPPVTADSPSPALDHVPPAAPPPDPTLADGEDLPPEATPDTTREFITEAGEYVETIEGLMLSIEAEPTAEHLNGIFRLFHTVKGLAGFLHLRRIQVLAHASEDLLHRLRSGTNAIARSEVDLLLAAVDQLKLLLAGLGEGLAHGRLPPSPELPRVVADLRSAARPRPAPLGELLIAGGAVGRATVEAALTAQKHLQTGRRLGEILVDAGQVSDREVAQALARQTPTESGTSAVPPPVTTMRVEIGRVDALNDAIGELVIAQNMVACCPELRALGSRRVHALLAQLDRVTHTIQDMSMRLRLVSIQPVFQRMVRLGRDAARTLGKEVEIITEGEDQELDKSVVERLGEPLVHLVRNAIDHGLEGADARRAAGKPPVGRVVLRAGRRSGSFCVEIVDDGRGLDRDRILAKARQRGLVREGQQPSDDEILHLIFLPGFSTVEQVTDLSGRGVGMDVVRRMVEELRGQVLLASEAGRGTTVTILLPLTLAIIDGMEIGVGDQRYILPTLSVVTSLRPTAETMVRVRTAGRLLSFAGHQLPVYDLREVLAGPPTTAARPLVVVVEDGKRRAGLLVDAIHGRHQVVVKAMAKGLPPAPGIGGASIGGDGRVCLVCDIPALINLATSSSQTPATIP